MALISFSLFVLYINTIINYYNIIPESLSRTYYILGKYGYIFTIVMILIGVTVFFPMISVTPESFKFLAFLSSIGICFVGVSPNFIDSTTGKIHDISAYLSALCSILWIILATDYWYLILVSAALCSILGALTKTLKTCFTWWLEMVVFLSVYTSLIP